MHLGDFKKVKITSGYYYKGMKVSCNIYPKLGRYEIEYKGKRQDVNDLNEAFIELERLMSDSVKVEQENGKYYDHYYDKLRQT